MMWTKQKPIPGGKTDVWKCGGDLCGALTSKDRRKGHDKDFHTEERSYGGYTQGSSTMGHTLVYITCPFCRTEVECHLWSLSGGGKKCPCGALFNAYGTAKKTAK